MNSLIVKFTLESDATFGRGDGVAGLVDQEVQHDRYGLPLLNGRTLKGLLRAECAEILFAIGRALPEQFARWERAAEHLFGLHGSGTEEAALMRVGDARLPPDLRDAITEEWRGKNHATRAEMLESLTTLRRQTAMDPTTGAPQKETLRTMRVIIRNTPFEARLDFRQDPQPDDLALLAACVKTFRRAGTGRNRGRGRLNADLYSGDSNNPITPEHFAHFTEAMKA
jgi:CRISPR/Cas system CSM-associated protein Csm3 (group 7 of RAMP superfamily)